ncbi:metal ABC transporter substrate-binding protein [Halorarum salinum]|uniref:Zinc ABC transporter substrate-binding protein n=1 Tax=Halorarum salinum TaxID=2743089 RepID=A0A7D5QCK2_9EURY|nr:zinc ABC transporter substrate-binding protein [Halobaculum salinum]QLG64256.1 zinc ABC transporter substrate-binding protein [Halobaculum salinum]
MRCTRRRAVATTAGVLGLTAGCAGTPTDAIGADGDDGRTSAGASFFVLGDLTTAVAGDRAAADTLVPVGQHGHGWEPGPRIQERVREADLFVYAMAGFQPWADDVVRGLREDDSPVRAVAAGGDVDLLDVGGDHEGEHDEARGHDGDGGHHDGFVHDEEDGHDHGEGPGDADPHFWLDPVRVNTAVSTVEAAFAEVDPDGADAYAAAADDYRGRLDDLHADFEEGLAGTARDTVVVAGHDSFAHLGDRYGFSVEALTGLSPDEQPTSRDVERAREHLAEHDAEYVLADPLGSQSAADQLAAEADVSVLPLTPIPGVTEEWEANGWGYVEIMREVNLPTLRRALDA